MSGQSIVAAARTILTNNLPQLNQVEDLDAIPFRITPESSPCVLLQLMREPEVPVAHGKARVDADLDVHVWNAVSAPTIENADDFKGLVNDIAVELRKQPYLDGLANVGGESQITLASRRLTPLFTRPLIRPNRVWQHAVITSRIVEFVNTPI